MTRSLIVFGGIVLPGIASAHADHASGGDYGIVHFLSDPLHLGLAFAAVVLAVALRSKSLGRS